MLSTSLQDPMDYINQEEDIELDIRPDAGLLPAEDDLLAGGFSLDIDDDGSDSGTGPDTSDPQPEWLRLFEIMLVWLNVEHSVPDRTCELLLAYLQSVYYTISSASSSSARRPLPSARMARIRKSLGLEGYGITYALCPDRSCLTPHLLKEVIERQTGSCRRCGLALVHDPQPQALSYFLFLSSRIK
ncbi:hypothetical protein A4X06_0g9256 [Tilletia controversa]|uniref:Uncharacterized protein n=1 Tax=Tilletia controversa TaxID=13291 RepID=A0A8X7MJ94_9BASI|nr:hypothetical protein CF328_g8809 [Tilletia controversa]KAE8237344.1 hypothetical protein A4X06_0g9256 [Tilletia controversa]